MSSLNIEYNGKTIPIANVGIVSSKEKVIFGSLERDLLLQTLGSVQIQVGNKFYELPFNTDGSWAGGNLNIKDIDGLDNLDLSLYSNGTFLYDTKGNVLYLIHNKTLITISGSDDDNQIFLSYINEQTLTGAQKQRLVLNAGQFLNSIQDVKRLTFEDVYDGMIVFVNDEKVHYLLTNSRYPNEISSWETFYIGSQGGIIKNGLIIKNQTRANLLYLNEIDPMQSNIFNGLKIGSDEKWIKTSVNILDQSLIDYNTKEFLIKNQSFKLFHVVNNNIGIRGDASGSDDYNIVVHGSFKMNGPFFTDKKMASTDFNTINMTHWDGGRGFGLTRGSDSKWNLEIDNLIVRDSLVANKMVLKSLEVERAYATGGHILVTDGAVINSYNYRKPTAEELQTANITYNGNHGTLEADSYYYFVTFKESTEKDDNDAYVSLPTTPAFPSENNLTDNIEKDTLDVDKNCPFIAGDVLLCQTASGLTAKRYYAYVSYSTNKYIAIKSNHLRNNVIYQRDNEGNPISVFKDFAIEANDSLIRITNLLTDNEGVYKNKNRRRFIDIDGTRNQITMYDNLGNPNLFSGAPNADGFYDDIEIITGIGQNGSLRLRMGELSDLGINGITGYGLYCDNVLLKGKLIVKDPSGEYPIGATKGVWIPGNTNTYYLNDIISYNGSAYRCVVQHTNTAELQAIPGISDFWEIWVQKGNDGVAGTSFKYVDISGEQVFVYDQELDSFDKVNIPLSCTAFNIDYANLVNIKFDWSIGGTTIKSRTYLKAEVLSGTIIDSINIYPREINETINWDNYWVDNKSISVTCKVYTNDSLIYDSDVFSVYKVKNGEDSYSVLLSNEAMTVPCLPDGSFPSNIFDSPYKYQTELQVYNGITKLIYGQDYFIAFTNGLISLVNSSTIGQDHGLLSVSGFSTADLTINHGSINITVNILRDSVIFLSFIKTISISKAQQGPLLDWIKEWDQNSTIVGADKIISPRIFTGTNDVNGITGVTLGRNAFGLTEVGVGGYYHSQPTFSLNTNGEIIIGAKNNSITYQTTTYNAGTNYLSFSLANGLEISADVKFKDPNGSYTLQGYVANNTPIIYRDAYTTSINKSTFAPTGVKNKDLWYPLSYDSGSITYNGYFFIYDSTQVGDKWVIAGDNTITTINGGIITSGTIQLGSSGTTNSGVTGLTDVGDTNPVRFWAGDTFANRNIADFKVHENGLLEIGNTNASYTLDGNGLLTTGTGLILYTDPTTHSGGLSTKKLGIKPDGSVYIDGSVLVSNIAGSSENIALSQLLSYFVLKTVEGVNFLSTTYPIVSEKEITAYGSSILPGEGGGGTVGSLGGLANVGLWADDVPASDRIMVQLAGATHWSSKLLSEIVGLDTVALGAYLVANSYAKQSYVDARVAELVGTAPATLDTLNELAAALGNDPNFATSMSTLIGTKWTQDNAKIANWDSAFGALHSHTNKTELDGITSTLISNWNLAFTNNHTHPNKAIIDSLTQANLDVLAKLSIVDGNLKVDTNLWSTGEVSAYGAGSGSGGGSGLITSVLGSVGLGGAYLDSDLTNTFNAYTINFINTNLTSALGRIGALETSTPNVAWGIPTSQYSPLTINSVTRNLSVDGHTHSYLPLSGGNLTGAVTINGSTVWHAGNDGAGSGLDADTIDGLHSSSFFKVALNSQTSVNDYTFWENSAGKLYNTPDAPYNYYSFLSFGQGIYQTQFNGYNNSLKFRSGSESGLTNKSWRTVAFEDSNVASATKLANTRTIWGQNFNGEGNVSGALSGATTGTFSSTISATTGIFSNLTANYIPKHTAGGLANSLIYDNGTNVGIGRADPQYKLDVNGSFRSMGNGYINGVLRNIYEGDPLTGAIVSKSLAYNSSPFGLITRIYGTGTVSLQSQRESNDSETFGLALQPLGGNVGIGTTSPSYKLDVNGTFRAVGAAYLNSTLEVTSYATANRFYTGYDSGFAGSVSCSNWFRSSGATGWFSSDYGGGIYMDDATYVKVYGSKSFWVNGNIVATGEITAYSASDVRLKTEITTLKDSLRIIELLNPVSYKWNSIAKELNPLKGNKTDYGLIAQELESVMPELVHTVYGQYKSVDYVKIIPHLICAIKQLKMEVDHLKKTYY